MSIYSSIDYQDICIIEKIEFEDKSARQEVLQQDPDFFPKDIDTSLAGNKKVDRMDLFWTAFRNCSLKITYDWLSTDTEKIKA
jgi:hypothetical protein